MAELHDFKTHRRNRNGWIKAVTMDPHGETNADGSKRDHCCGCWNVWSNPLDPFALIAECNECGEERSVRIPGIDP